MDEGSWWIGLAADRREVGMACKQWCILLNYCWPIIMDVLSWRSLQCFIVPELNSLITSSTQIKHSIPRSANQASIFIDLTNAPLCQRWKIKRARVSSNYLHKLDLRKLSSIIHKSWTSNDQKNNSILNINAQIVSIQWQEDEVSIIQATFLILARHLFQKGF